MRTLELAKGAATLYDMMILVLFGAMIFAPCLVAINTGVLDYEEEEDEIPYSLPFPASETSETVPFREPRYRRTYFDRKLRSLDSTSTTQAHRVRSKIM